MDLPAYLVRLSRVEEAIPLISLATGHVGVPVRYPSGTIPAVSDSALARAEAGEEVTACDDDVEHLLGRNGEHHALAVAVDEGSDLSALCPVAEGPLDDESSICSGEDAENFVTFMESEVEEKPARRPGKGRRMRAEPFSASVYRV